jgi:hypothetical protein
MRKNMLFFFLLLPIFFHLGCVIYFHFGETFKPRQFEHGFKKSYSTVVAGLDYSQLDSALCQRFTYLGRGLQMTAFISEDGNYVLKFFHPRIPLKSNWYLNWKNWKRTYSLKWISTNWFQTGRRLEKMFNRLKIAYSVLRDETGLVFIHLAPSDRVNHFVHVIDKQGKAHLMNLNQTPFVLQKKAMIASDYLDQLANENRVDELKEAITLIEQLFAKRLKLGITDPNQNMDINYGFVDGRPIQIDVGRIRSEPILLIEPEEEQKRILDNFHKWLSNRYSAKGLEK